MPERARWGRVIPGWSRGAIVGALVALWVGLLALGFVAQTTELFGARRGALVFLLLGVAALGFIVIGCVGVWLTLGGFDEHPTSSDQPEEGGDA